MLEGLIGKDDLHHFDCSLYYDISFEDLAEVVKVDERFQAIKHSNDFMYATSTEGMYGKFAILNVTPMGAPRANQGKSWFARGKNYMMFKDKLREEIERVGFKVKNGYLDLIFCMPIPNIERGSKRSVREKVSRHGQPHRQKPDVDNILKGFMDAMFTDDAMIYRVTAIKVWTFKPGIILCLR